MLSTPNNGPVLVPTGPFRRYATRYEPSRRDACLAWRELPPPVEQGPDGIDRADEPESHQEFALLLDISHMGASVALDVAPVEGHGVWLRLEGDCLTEWSEAEVVGVTVTNRGPHLVRLAFRSPCPFETLKAAVCG